MVGKAMLTYLCYRTPDLIVEVAHPSITVDYGEKFLGAADYMVSNTFYNNLLINRTIKK